MQIKKYLNKLFEIVLIVCLILAFSWFYENIYFPSKLSVMSGCQIINQTELNDLGYELAGYYNYSNDKIVIIKNTPTVNQHEICHQVQAMQGRLNNNCSKRFWMMQGEIECKIAEYYPDWLFKIKYQATR